MRKLAVLAASAVLALGVVPAGASPPSPSAFRWHCDITADPPVGAYAYLFGWVTADCTTPTYVVTYALLERVSWIAPPVVVRAGIDSQTGTHLAYLVRVPCKRPPGVVPFNFGAIYQLRVFVVMTAGGTSIVESGVSDTRFVPCGN